MGAKSRGNHKPGYDNGRDENSYQTGKRIRIVYGEEGKTYGHGGISIIEHQGSDGSPLEKPMSKAYMENIRSRKHASSDYTKETFPGDYGSGKKVK